MRKIKSTELSKIRDELLAKQNGKCIICGRTVAQVGKRNMCVDHDHATGVIRSVLCRSCNMIEGKLKSLLTRYVRIMDKQVLIQRMFAYWEYHRLPRTRYIHHLHGVAKKRRKKK